MDEKFKTSFIPKEPLGSSERRDKTGMGLFMIGSIFIFIVSVVLAGAVFAGQKYLSAQLVKDKEAFAEAQKVFDSVTVDYLIKLSQKIELARKVLANHTVVLPIFDYLQSNTYKTARFSSFKLSFLEDKSINLDMKGEAKSFDAIALQSDVFIENKNFKNPIISDVDRVTDSIVFSFKTQVDPAFILYNKKANTQQ